MATVTMVLSQLRWLCTCTYKGKTQTPQLAVAGAVPWFDERTSRVCQLSSFLRTFQWEICRQTLSGDKTPAEMTTAPTAGGEINFKVIDFAKLVQNHLKWLSHSVRFLSKKSNNSKFILVCTK